MSRVAPSSANLGGLRRRIEIALLPDDVHVVLQLDVRARRERGGVSKKSPRSRQVRALVLGSRRQILPTWSDTGARSRRGRQALAVRGR
jgi:hypothetical protein